MIINGKKTEDRIKIIILKLGKEEYAINIDQIKEVVTTPKIAKVPQTSNYIKGISNIRGNIITIMCLEELFNLNDKLDDSIPSYTLVVESNEFKTGILVKEVPNTLSILTSEIDSSSDIIRYTLLDEKCIKGIIKSKDRMIILIDILELLLSINNDLKKINKI